MSEPAHEPPSKALPSGRPSERFTAPADGPGAGPSARQGAEPGPGPAQNDVDERDLESNPARARAWLEQGRFEDVLRACRAVESAASEGALEFGPARRALWGALRLDAREALAARIEELSHQGDDAGAARLLGLLVREDPAAADSCHVRLEFDRPAAQRPAFDPSGPAAGSATGGDEHSAGWARRSGVLRGAGAKTARLVADDLGELLVVSAAQLVLGAGGLGQRALGAELPDRLLLERKTSLSGGDRWLARALAGGGVVIDGEALGPAGAFLGHGSRIGLSAPERTAAGRADAYSLHVRCNDPSSASLLLELGRGFHCAGVRAILLLCAGPGGRVTLGRSSRHLLHAPSLRGSLGIELGADGRLTIDAEQSLRVVRHEADTPPEPSGSTLALDWPIAGRVDLELGPGSPPYWLSLQPGSEVRP